MSFKVGIIDNIVVNKVTKNDKGSLVVSMKQIEDISPMDRLNQAGSTTFDAAENDFLIYSPKNVDFNGNKLDSKAVEKEIANIKDPLDHILSQYITKSNIKWDMFKGAGIDGANYDSKMVEQSSIDKIYANIVTQFITQITPFIGESGKKLRGLFIRQSTAKHFPALRKRFLDSQPFLESMSIPKEASKLKFSKYEIDKGLNLADAVQAAAAPSQVDAASAESLFAK